MNLPANFLSRSFAVIGLAVAMYAAAALAFGWAEFRTHLSAFSVPLLFGLMGLSLLNYGLRFWRWNRYLHRLGRPLQLRPSLAVYFAAYTMVITPGKIGEVFKAGILKERYRYPLSCGLVIVLAERIYDILGVLILAVVCLTAWEETWPSWSLLLVVAALPLTLLLLRMPRIRQGLFDRMGKSARLGRSQESWQEGFKALDRLLAPGESVRSLAITVPAWGCECLGLWLACRALGYPLEMLEAGFIYAAATVVGSVSFLPGGLGGTEAVMVWLLGSKHIPEPAGIAIALVVRLATLWLAVLVGLVFFLAFRRLLLGGEPAQGSDSLS